MEQATIIPTESRRRRFRAWDNIRRIFQRSSSKGSSPLGQQQQTEGHQRPRLLSVFTMPRSRSTSELQAMATTKVTPGTTSAPQPIPSSSSNSFGGGGGGGVTNAVGKGSVGAATGLSVSQDSVFAFDEDSPGGSNYRGDHQQHQKRQQTQKQMMSELQKVIGSRTHRSADDDEGLPRSPVAIRHHLPSVTTSVGGRCGLDSSISSPVYGSGGGSDPSLISINSCELEEASCDSLHSRNPSSSKVLIQRPPTAPVEVAAATAAAAAAVTDVQVDQVDGLLLMGMSSSSSASAVPLSHNAALHKRAVRPKKSHAPARHRQLPQLAPGSGGGGGMEFDIGIEDSFIVSTVVAVAERKKGGGGGGGGGERQLDNLLLKPPLPSSPIKQRSLSLGRAVDSVMVSQQPVVAGEEDESTATADAAAAGPSAAKVARSKSSVEKKFQHEVAGFWRRKEFNRLFKSGGGGGSQSRDRSQENRSDGTTGGEGEREKEQQGPPSTGKRKDLRKIKKDKEEKRKRSDAAGRSESPSPPAAFLSRFFGSRRSGRSRNNNEAINNKSSGGGKNKTDTPASGPLSLPPPEPVQSTPPVPMPRSVFIHRSADHQEDGAAGEELEVNWTMPSPSSPPPSTVAAVGRTSVNSSGVVVVPADRWIETAAAADTTSYVRMPASSSSLVSPKLNRKEQAAVAVPPPSSPLPTRHHRIHIAGLSPYQRRVQRIGNGLQVTDDDEDDWDSPTDAPNTSYHFRRPAPAANRSVVQRTSPLQQQQQQQHDVTAAPESLPVNINHEFILKRASPPSASASDNIRRSLEVLKFSNEGLKKTIDSLNHHQEQKRRMSQSSDQLQLSDSCSNKRDESSAAASRSNSTSSLNISDVADDPAAIDTGLSSSIASLAHSAHSVDEKDVHDDVLIVDDHREKNEQYRWSPSPSVVPQVSGPSSPPPLDTDNNRGGAGPSSRAWENRQMAVPQQQHQQPMFSMSVRVQNPPPLHDERVQYKYKRSVSSPCNENEPKSLHCDIGRSSYQPSASSSRPSFISPSSSSSSSSSPPRPWQSKEEKERQNKWALISPSGAAIATDATSGDVGDESIKATPSLLMLMDMDLPPDVKLRPKKTSTAVSVTGGQQQQQQETSELLKVFARRSLKVRDSQEIVLTVEDVVAAESLAVEPEVIQQGSIAPPPPQPPPPLDSPKKKKKPLARPPLTSIRSPSAVANESNLLIRLPPPSPHDPLAIVSKAERGSYSLTSPPHQQPFSEQQPSAHEDIIWKRLSQTKNYIQPPRPSPTTQQPHFINEKLPVKSSGHDQVHRTETKSSTPSTPATSVTTAATAAAAAPQGRQSKVLAMVHNIQRLQVT